MRDCQRSQPTAFANVDTIVAQSLQLTYLPRPGPPARRSRNAVQLNDPLEYHDEPPFGQSYSKIDGPSPYTLAVTFSAA